MSMGATGAGRREEAKPKANAKLVQKLQTSGYLLWRLLRSKKQQSRRELHEEVEEGRESLRARTKVLQKKKQRMVKAATVARQLQDVWQQRQAQPYRQSQWKLLPGKRHTPANREGLPAARFPPFSGDCAVESFGAPEGLQQAVPGGDPVPTLLEEDARWWLGPSNVSGLHDFVINSGVYLKYLVDEQAGTLS